MRGDFGVDEEPNFLFFWGGRIVDGGSLTVLNTWLTEAKDSNNTKQLRLILKTLLHLPVSVPTLQSSSIGKVVNKLKTYSDANVVSFAKQCVKLWKDLLSSVAEKVTEETLQKKRPLEDAESKQAAKKEKTATGAAKPVTTKDSVTKQSSSENLNKLPTPQPINSVKKQTTGKQGLAPSQAKTAAPKPPKTTQTATNPSQNAPTSGVPSKPIVYFFPDFYIVFILIPSFFFFFFLTRKKLLQQVMN